MAGTVLIGYVGREASRASGTDRFSLSGVHTSTVVEKAFSAAAAQGEN